MVRNRLPVFTGMNRYGETRGRAFVEGN